MRHQTSIYATVALLMAAGASAQTLPDAGALMRQTEQNIRFSQMQQAAQARESHGSSSFLLSLRKMF